MLAVGVAVAAPALAGCSGDEASAGGDSLLLEALSAVRDTAVAREYVEFGDLALLAAAESWDVEGLGSIGAAGTGQLGPRSADVAELTGVDLADLDWAIIAGQPPETVGVLGGEIDRDRVVAALAELDYTSEADEGGVSLERATGLDLGDPLQQLVLDTWNTVHLDDATFAYARDQGGLARRAGDDTPTLADESSVTGALASCLGDDLGAATFSVDPLATQAAGVRLTEADGATEVVCLLVPGGAERADEAVAELEQVFASGSDPQGVPFGELMPGAVVDSLSVGERTMVRVVASSGGSAADDTAAVGAGLRLLQTRALAIELG